MKILFLDVDGVLNYDNCKASVGMYYGVERDKVKLLKKIIDATGAKIVLCSTWRRDITPGMPVECQDNPFAIELMSKLAAEQLKLYDYTPIDSSDMKRAKQIMDLIKEYRRNGNQIDAWIVLDDEYFEGYEQPEFEDHVITTYSNVGLTEKEVDQTIKALGGSR